MHQSSLPNLWNLVYYGKKDKYFLQLVTPEIWTDISNFLSKYKGTYKLFTFKTHIVFFAFKINRSLQTVSVYSFKHAPRTPLSLNVVCFKIHFISCPNFCRKSFLIFFNPINTFHYSIAFSDGMLDIKMGNGQTIHDSRILTHNLYSKQPQIVRDLRWPRPAVAWSRISVPQPEIEARPQKWEHWILATRPWGPVAGDKALACLLCRNEFQQKDRK